MITLNNLNYVVKLLTEKDKKRIQNTSKEYCVLEIHTFNVGSVVTIKLTNNYDRYSNVGNLGNCILECYEIREILDTNK